MDTDGLGCTVAPEWSRAECRGDMLKVLEK